jgi:hypothetical protein
MQFNKTLYFIKPVKDVNDITFYDEDLKIPHFISDTNKSLGQDQNEFYPCNY